MDTCYKKTDMQLIQNAIVESNAYCIKSKKEPDDDMRWIKTIPLSVTFSDIVHALKEWMRSFNNSRMIKVYCPQGYLLLGQLYAEAGQKEDAEKHLKIAESMYLDRGSNFWLGKTREILAQVV